MNQPEPQVQQSPQLAALQTAIRDAVAGLFGSAAQADVSPASFGSMANRVEWIRDQIKAAAVACEGEWVRYARESAGDSHAAGARESFTEYAIRYVGRDTFIDTPIGPVLVGEITIDNGLIEVPESGDRSRCVPGRRMVEVRDEHGSLIWPYHDLLPLRLPGEGGPGRHDPLIRHPGAPQ